MNATTPPTGPAGNDPTARLLEAIEQQLTRHYSRVAGQIEAARKSEEQQRQALTSSIEARLNEFAQYQHQQLIGLDDRINELGDSSAHHAATASAADLKGVDASIAEVRDNVDALAASTSARLESLDSTATQRLVDLEQRINHTQGTQIAELAAIVGRAGSANDEAIAALSSRLSDLSGQVDALTRRTDELSAAMSAVDTAALTALRAELDAAHGQISTMRTDLGALSASTSTQFSTHDERLGLLETPPAAEAAISTDMAVQLDRLDDLERQITSMRPDRAPARELDVEPVWADSASELAVEPVIEPAPAPTLPVAPAATPAPVAQAAAAPVSDDPESLSSYLSHLAASLAEPAASTAPTETTPAPVAAVESVAPTGPTPIPLTRTIAAPPSMSLVPKLAPAQPEGSDDPTGELPRPTQH